MSRFFGYFNYCLKLFSSTDQWLNPPLGIPSGSHWPERNQLCAAMEKISVVKQKLMADMFLPLSFSTVLKLKRLCSCVPSQTRSHSPCPWWWPWPGYIRVGWKGCRGLQHLLPWCICAVQKPKQSEFQQEKLHLGNLLGLRYHEQLRSQPHVPVAHTARPWAPEQL